MTCPSVELIQTIIFVTNILKDFAIYMVITKVFFHYLIHEGDKNGTLCQATLNRLSQSAMMHDVIASDHVTFT